MFTLYIMYVIHNMYIIMYAAATAKLLQSVRLCVTP